MFKAVDYNSGRRYRDAWFDQFNLANIRLVHTLDSSGVVHYCLETPLAVWQLHSAAPEWKWLTGSANYQTDCIKYSNLYSDYRSDVYRRYGRVMKSIIDRTTDLPALAFAYEFNSNSVWFYSGADIDNQVQEIVWSQNPFMEGQWARLPKTVTCENTANQYLYPRWMPASLIRKLVLSEEFATATLMTPLAESLEEEVPIETNTYQETTNEAPGVSTEATQQEMINSYNQYGVDTTRSENMWPTLPWCYTLYYANVGWLLPSGFSIDKTATRRLWDYDPARWGLRYLLMEMTDPGAAGIAGNQWTAPFHNALWNPGQLFEGITGIPNAFNTLFLWPCEGNEAFGREDYKPRLSPGVEADMASFAQKYLWQDVSGNWRQRRGKRFAYTLEDIWMKTFKLPAVNISEYVNLTSYQGQVDESLVRTPDGHWINPLFSKNQLIAAGYQGGF